jgi:3-oxosteroid 1-dehydrogenase
MSDDQLVVIGCGMAGLAAAVAAHDLGLRVHVIEKGNQLGGTAAYSGGQVWVGGNHVAQSAGFDDSVEAALAYVRAIADEQPDLQDQAMAERWVRTAPLAARHFEEQGAVKWAIMPDYPDYYFPTVAGSRRVGRYLTGQPFDGRSSGEWRARLLDGPYFPIGITYGEIFAWGGAANKRGWDWDLVARRRRDDVLTFGQGLMAHFIKAAIERQIPLLSRHAATEILMDARRVVGVRVGTPTGTLDLHGSVVLASGGYDWDADLTETYSGVPPADGGSNAPRTATGDAFRLAEQAGAAIATKPPYAAPRGLGFQLAEPAFAGDPGYRQCTEHSLPHAFVVNRAGRRFSDDSFYFELVRAGLERDAMGQQPNLPMYMIWDEDHHQRYGLGPILPGEPYPDGLVTSAPTIGEVGELLGIDSEQLALTAERFNVFAMQGTDPDFGRGSNFSVQHARGDRRQEPNHNLGPVARPPFYGMRLRLLGVGITAAGVRTDEWARVRSLNNEPIPGFYAAGTCSALLAAGSGYNSGFGLSQAMTFGYIAAQHLAHVRQAGVG